MLTLMGLLLVLQLKHESTLADRYRSEFPEAVARNREFYTHLVGSGTFYHFAMLDVDPRLAASSADTKKPNRREVLLERRTLSFAFAGPMERMEYRTIERKKVLGKKSPPEVVEEVSPPGSSERYGLCIGPDIAVRVHWDSENGPPVLDNLQKPEESKTIHSQINNTAKAFLSSPFRLIFLSDEKFFTSSMFILRKVTPVVKEGVTLAHVEFDIKWPKNVEDMKINHIKSGWFDARPDQGWVIQEYHAVYELPRSSLAVTIDYAGKQENLPLPKRVVFAHEKSRDVLELESIRHAEVDGREFTAAAFGLPQITQPGKSGRPSSVGYWLAGLAAVTFVAALAFRYYSVRGRKVSGNK